MRLFLVLWLLTLMFCPPLTAAPLVLTAEEQAWLDKHKDNIVLGFEYFFLLLNSPMLTASLRA